MRTDRPSALYTGTVRRRSESWSVTRDGTDLVVRTAAFTAVLGGDDAHGEPEPAVRAH
ncbi:hypothetical protein ACF09K_18265 [Streptomyces sp. NPDC014882]|uniref:hypothetical protein n=1 Tax=Streptomyces sp. NPDC014882 TaxID=3364927 RepID=UPI003702DB9F